MAARSFVRFPLEVPSDKSHAGEAYRPKKTGRGASRPRATFLSSRLSERACQAETWFRPACNPTSRQVALVHSIGDSQVSDIRHNPRRCRRNAPATAQPAAWPQHRGVARVQPNRCEPSCQSNRKSGRVDVLPPSLDNLMVKVGLLSSVAGSRTMQQLFRASLLIGVVGFSIVSTPLLAASASCSGRRDACVQRCGETGWRCQTVCKSAHSDCMSTGCWDTSLSPKQCGLARQ